MSVETVDESTTRASARPLSREYDTALLDLDGVVYAGGLAVPHAVAALGEARDGGMRLAFVTNNAARTPETVAAHLTRLGLAATPAEVITSAQAVARLIAERVPAGAAVLCAGGEGLREALRERGLRPVDSADDGPAAVAQGYGGLGMTWGTLAEAAVAVGRGVPWFASNADATIPGERGLTPGNGAAVEVVRIATGHAGPVVAGKPRPPMHREAVLRTGARRPLVVGDRLDTDIEGARNGGVDSLLVLTGVTDAALLLSAPPEHRPSYVAADLRGLLAPHPAVGREPGGEGFRCGGWRAAARDGRLCLERAGTRTAAGDRAAADGVDDVADGLRALCAAAWTQAGPGRCLLPADRALSRLGL